MQASLHLTGTARITCDGTDVLVQEPHADAPASQEAVGCKCALEVVGQLLQARARLISDPELLVHGW